MLKITIPASELSDGRIFWYTKETTLTLEHSLVSLSKWESKWKKPFIGQQITTEMFDDYIRCMTITQNVNPDVYLCITPKIREIVQKYMDDPMTAAIIHDDSDDKRRGKQFTTSDLIYYWMVALQIPFECQKWHLNRLLTLIKITNIEQAKAAKQDKKGSAKEFHALNAARRAKSKMRK